MADRPIAREPSRPGSRRSVLCLSDGIIRSEMDILRVRRAHGRIGVHPILRPLIRGPPSRGTPRGPRPRMLRGDRADVRLRGLPHGPPGVSHVLHKPVLRHRPTARQRRDSRHGDAEEPLGLQHPVRAAVVLGARHPARRLFHPREPVVAGAKGAARRGP